MYINYSENLAKAFHDETVKYLNDIEDGYNQKSILNVTFKFAKSDFGTITEEINDRYSKFDLFYKKICSHMNGRRYFRQPIEVMPMAWVGLEAGSHKYSIGVNSLTDIHLHTLWIFDKEQRNTFAYVREKVLNMNNSHFSDIYISDEVDFSENNTENILNAMSYLLKFQRNLYRNAEIGDSMRRYPDHLNGEFRMVRLHQEARIQAVVLEDLL